MDKVEDTLDLVHALLETINRLEEDYPAFSVAMSQKLGRNIPEEERHKYIFYFIQKDKKFNLFDGAHVFTITIDKKDIERPYQDNLYKLLKSEIRRKQVEWNTKE